MPEPLDYATRNRREPSRSIIVAVVIGLIGAGIAIAAAVALMHSDKW